MSKKIMNLQRWRFLAIVAVFDLGTLALCVPFYLKEPADKKPIILGMLVALLCVGLVGVGIIVSLWRRFPVPDEKDQTPDAMPK
jgi:hypothetical protein